MVHPVFLFMLMVVLVYSHRNAVMGSTEDALQEGNHKRGGFVTGFECPKVDSRDQNWTNRSALA